MEASPAARLLAAWERGASEGVAERALRLLALALPESTRDTLLDLTPGQRDAALLRLRAAWFGPSLTLAVPCPACREPLECDVAVAELLEDHGPASPVSVRLESSRIEARVPTLRDLQAIGGESDRSLLRAALLERCVQGVEIAGQPSSLSALSPEALSALDRALGAADPQVRATLSIVCDACSAAAPVPFDIAVVLWEELEAWAKRTLSEVHALASAYGWGEAEVLSLSPQRRFHYLELTAVR
jgi:hypothetical protein